jgi:hypothetical protein
MTNHATFIAPHSVYRGVIRPENLVFNANLQEFSQRVSFICNLETNGKLSPEEAFHQLQDLWSSLAGSYETLGVGQQPFGGDSSDPSA